MTFSLKGTFLSAVWTSGRNERNGLTKWSTLNPPPILPHYTNLTCTKNSTHIYKNSQQGAKKFCTSKECLSIKEKIHQITKPKSKTVYIYTNNPNINTFFQFMLTKITSLLKSILEQPTQFAPVRPKCIKQYHANKTSFELKKQSRNASITRLQGIIHQPH